MEKKQQQQQQHGPALYLHCKRGEKASQDSIFWTISLRNESKANEEQKHGTFPFLKRKNKLNMFLWNRFITCFNGPHSIRPYIVKVLSDYSFLYPQPFHRLRVVFAHENRTEGGLFQEEPGHNCFLEDNLDSRCYETFFVLSDQCSAYCTCNKHRNQQ